MTPTEVDTSHKEFPENFVPGFTRKALLAAMPNPKTPPLYLQLGKKTTSPAIAKAMDYLMKSRRLKS